MKIKKIKIILKILKIVGIICIIAISFPISLFILIGYTIGVKLTNRKYNLVKNPKIIEKNSLKFSSNKKIESKYNRLNEVEL